MREDEEGEEDGEDNENDEYDEDEDEYQVIKVREVEIAKEVKRSDGLWRFACGDVYAKCIILLSFFPAKYVICAFRLWSG